MSQIDLCSPSNAPEAIIQEGPLFDPTNYTSLIQIVNQLDPASFVKFARTCKYLQNFCYNAQGIQVKFPCVVPAEESETSEPVIAIRKVGANQRVNGREISEEELRKLQKMPFVIVVTNIDCFEVDARILEGVRQMLLRFPRVVVEIMTCWSGGFVDWNDCIQFLQEYKVKRVCIMGCWPVIPGELLPFFLTNLDEFCYPEYVADDLILSATAKHLRLNTARISKYTLIDLLQKFANEDFTWQIGRDGWFEAEEDELDPLIEACSEVMKIVEQEGIDWKNMEPNVLYNNTLLDHREFYLLKSNGSIGKLTIFQNCVFFEPRMEEL